MQPPCTKVFAGPHAYLQKIAFFAARCFPNSLFYKTALFAASEALYTKSSKVFGFLRLRPQSCTADARSCGSRQKSQRFTLRFSEVQILFQVLLPSELESLLRFFVQFISSAIQRQSHYAFSKVHLCICYVRLPSGFLWFCPLFMSYIEQGLSAISDICILSSKLTTYCAVVRVV